MKLRLLLMIVIIGLFNTSSKYKDKIPSFKIRQTFALLLNSNSSDNYGGFKIAYDSLIHLTDSNLINFLPNISFYSLIMVNYGHITYNLGEINTVAAVNKLDTSDVRLLVPLSYCESSSNFFTIFYGKPITNKEQLCQSISSLFCKAYTRGSFNCSKEMIDLHTKTHWSTDTLFVTTTWTDNCWSILHKNRDGKDYIVNKIAKYIFEGDNLKEINYDEWR